MSRSLVARLTWLEILTVLAAVLAFAAIALVVTAQMMKTERHAMVHAAAIRLASAFDGELAEESDSAAAAQGVVDDGLEAGLRVEVRDPRGGILATSLARRSPRPSRRVIATEAWEEAFIDSARSRGNAKITVVASDATHRTTLSALGRSLLIAALPILLLSLLFGRTIAARALHPLSTMAERAANLSLDRNPRSLGIQSGLTEVDRLGDSFDRLLERLDDAMRAERRLTADASHELRTPLTVLGGELDMLLEHAPSRSAEAVGLQRASDQVGAMRELVDAILLLHRSGETGASARSAFEIVDLGDLARESLADTRARYPDREGDLEIRTPDELLVKGHATLLASAVRNLIDNALKFTRLGDRVVVEVALTDSEAFLTVDDGGPGIRNDERERIFDPFYRGAESPAGASGFGLGLPILRRVARAHGGEVLVESSELGGARFVLRLPRLIAVSPPG